MQSGVYKTCQVYTSFMSKSMSIVIVVRVINVVDIVGLNLM